ncbi:helix-turn-helix domain-containing protein [Aliikangiella sp. G2MR2-5]|uniref:winged helix-turn-helix transcriptional regulator n=1 Tax=Aliikangiella sp. G2MR2-5 TaxID=2788943 RepID=UPI0018ABEAF1|nr:helix-turn-helix domain-containing protein [Aliikangiella sp. G2MR2-5]
MEYGQFCPIAKSMELIGERWTLLVLRELHMGARRFNELQRGLPLISPTILTKRLKELTDAEIIVRKKIAGQNGHEYFLTQAGKETLPFILAVGQWGMRWARGDLKDTDLDVGLLMLYLERSIKAEYFPGGQSVIHFKFTDLDKLNSWWLVVKENKVDTCLENPGQEVDVYLTTDLKTMIDCWMGDLSYKNAINDKLMTVYGQPALTRNIREWLCCSVFADLPPAEEI